MPVMHLGIHPGVVAFISADIFFLASALMAAALWRAIPRLRILSTLLFLVFGLAFLTVMFAPLLSSVLPDPLMGALGHMVNSIFNFPIPLIGNLGIVIVLLIVCGFPVLTTLAINHAMQQAALPEKWLRFARLPLRLVAFALLVMLLGLLSWRVYLAVFAPGVLFSLNFPPLPFNPWLITVVGMLICVVMAARAFSEKR
jgi:hypothetical protein